METAEGSQTARPGLVPKKSAALWITAAVAAMIVAAMQPQAHADPTSAQINDEVAAALYSSSAAQAALLRQQDGRFARMRAEITALQTQLRADEQAHAAPIIVLAERHDVTARQDAFVQALAQRDPQFAEYRQKILRYAATPEGMAAVLRSDSDTLFQSNNPAAPNGRAALGESPESQGLVTASDLYQLETNAKTVMDSCDMMVATISPTMRRASPMFDFDKNNADCYRNVLSLLNDLFVRSNAGTGAAAIDPAFKLQIQRDTANVLARLAAIPSSGAHWSGVVEEYDAMRKFGPLTPEDENAATAAAKRARLENHP